MMMKQMCDKFENETFDRKTWPHWHKVVLEYQNTYGNRIGSAIDSSKFTEKEKIKFRKWRMEKS